MISRFYLQGVSRVTLCHKKKASFSLTAIVLKDQSAADNDPRRVPYAKLDMQKHQRDRRYSKTMIITATTYLNIASPEPNIRDPNLAIPASYRSYSFPSRKCQRSMRLPKSDLQGPPTPSFQPQANPRASLTSPAVILIPSFEK